MMQNIGHSGEVFGDRMTTALVTIITDIFLFRNTFCTNGTLTA